MIAKFNGNEKIGAVVMAFPEAKEILNKYHIDTHCESDKELTDILHSIHVNADFVMNELNAAFRENMKILNHQHQDL
jgi:iron-sulfur cluster repair protein YtfE (RIC family)